MPHRRKKQRGSAGDPFARIERVADEAAEQVLEEDRLLRQHGIAPADRSQ